MAATQSVRVSRRRERNPATTADPEKVQGTMPNAQMYGVYGPQYAALLAQPQDSIALRVMNAGALQGEARREQENYAAEMEAARLADAELQRKNAYYGIVKKRDEALQGDVELGMGGARGSPVWNDEYGVWEAPLDDMRVNVANANTLNNDQAERYGVYSNAFKAQREAGMVHPDEYYGALLTPPTQMERAPVTSGTTPVTPGDATQRYAADQGLTAEQQMEIARTKAAAAENGDDIEAAVTVGANGVAQVVYKGTPEALQRNGIDPVTGQKINPKAGVVGGATSATPAAKPPVKQKPTQGGNAVRPVRDGRAIAMSLYPNMHITEVERKKDADYGSPTSWHKRSKAAIDSRPIEGMTFKQYVDGYKKAGYEIIEAIDETKKPSKGATGPHWHVVLGENKSDKVYAQRLKQHPNVQGVTQLDNGDTFVTLKDGTQRVYRRGKRIG